MADHTRIEWTDDVEPDHRLSLVQRCRHCYAATPAATRLKNHPSRGQALRALNAAGDAKFTGEVRVTRDGWTSAAALDEAAVPGFSSARMAISFHEKCAG